MNSEKCEETNSTVTFHVLGHMFIKETLKCEDAQCKMWAASEFFQTTTGAKALSFREKNQKQLTAHILKTDQKHTKGHILLEEPSWQQLFVFVLFVDLKKRILSKICILLCFAWLKNFCVFLIIFLWVWDSHFCHFTFAFGLQKKLSDCFNPFSTEACAA